VGAKAEFYSGFDALNAYNTVINPATLIRSFLSFHAGEYCVNRVFILMTNELEK
jgi:hypothetical protein